MAASPRYQICLPHIHSTPELCANPACSTRYHHLRAGRTFRFDCCREPHLVEADGECSCRAWLCAKCAAVYTLAYQDGAIELVPRASDSGLEAFDRLVAPERAAVLDPGTKQRMASGYRAMLRALRSYAQATRALPAPEPERCVIRSHGRMIFVSLNDVEWVEAASNYVCLHVGSETHRIREKISAFERGLDPRRFVRIHRSIIVNLAHARELQPCGSGEYVVLLESGKELPVGRTYRTGLQKLLRKNLFAVDDPQVKIRSAYQLS